MGLCVYYAQRTLTVLGITVESNQLDLFTACFIDAPIKQDLDGFEYPLFSLAKNKDMQQVVIVRGDTSLTITPSSEGRATQFDKDILLYCISQLMQAKKLGHELTSKVRLVAYDLLKTTKRGTDGRAYERLKDAGIRLRDTGLRVETARPDGTNKVEVYGFIDYFRAVETPVKTLPDGTEQVKMIAIDITLNQKTMEAIENNDVLTMHESYFDLTSPLDRRLYEIVRKGHGTNKHAWQIGVDKLHERSGSQSEMKEFRRMLKARIEKNLLPGYRLELEGKLLKTKRAPDKVMVLKPMRKKRTK